MLTMPHTMITKLRAYSLQSPGAGAAMHTGRLHMPQQQKGLKPEYTGYTKI
jgi:hypothetical protein